MGRCELLSVGQLISFELTQHPGGLTLMGSHPATYSHLGLCQPYGAW